LAIAWSHFGSLLRELGRLEQAAEAFDQALRLGADPDLHHYYLGALGRGKMPSAPPRHYVERLFDGYAQDFDAHLVGQLGYRAHTELLGRVQRAAPGTVFEHALDLGCGTGLCGPLIRPIARRLTGLDLSARMLERSRSRAVYDNLVQADAVAYLRQTPEQFDLVVAADVLIYLGDPAPLLASLQRTLLHGLLAFTAEVQEGDDEPAGWTLMTNLRYAHASVALRRLAHEHGFEPLLFEHAPVRNDQGKTVDGLYVVLRRR
jgi:predicted TPR repeat methyltransferase